MFTRAVYRLKAYLSRRALERACPELRTLRVARERITKRHGQSSKIAAKQRDLMHTALGWRGTR